MVEMLHKTLDLFLFASLQLKDLANWDSLILGRLDHVPGFHIGTGLLGLMRKERLGQTGQRGPNEVCNPVEFLTGPFPRD